MGGNKGMGGKGKSGLGAGFARKRHRKVPKDTIKGISKFHMCRDGGGGIGSVADGMQ